jgi:hypothetical protein
VRRADINSLADQFVTKIMACKMDGVPKTPDEWAREFYALCPGIPHEERLKVIRKACRIAAQVKTANDACM